MIFDGLDGRVARWPRTRRARSARSTTAWRTWWPSASRRPSSPISGASCASREYGARVAALRLARRVLLCRAAALRLARFNARVGHGGQALLRGPAEPVRRGRRRGVHLVLQQLARAGAVGPDRRIPGHGYRRRADGEQLQLSRASSSVDVDRRDQVRLHACSCRCSSC